MPTEGENVQYLYLVLTNGGPPQIDMVAVSKALDLSPGATSKRWSRLKQAMEQGKYPSAGSYGFLWLCVKHSTRDKTPDWHSIAKACGTTPGAASKRYSRMKQAFEKGDATPSSTTPTKSKATTNGDTTPTTTTKRKRVSATKKASKDVGKYKPGDEEPDDDEDFTPSKPKRARAGTAKATSTSFNPTEATTFIKSDPGMNPNRSVEDEEKADEHFYDAVEGVEE
ncbi:hypothetical protein BU26DRAFT_377441, partial [Trematosphaeria pertusa]